MGSERSRGWNTFCIVASAVWVATVAFYAIWQHGSEAERLRFWADSIEWSINSDPNVEGNAKELRTRLGDERFIAQAAAAYPRIDLRETLRRYEADRASRPRYRHDALAFALSAVVPPSILYLLGLGVLWLRAASSSSRSSFR
jgi:hypothetical protein